MSFGSLCYCKRFCTDLCIYVCVKNNLLSFTMVIDLKIPAFLCEPRNSGMPLPFEGQSAFLENSLFYINVL